jgi:hypothetical protein
MRNRVTQTHTKLMLYLHINTKRNSLGFIGNFLWFIHLFITALEALAFQYLTVRETPCLARAALLWYAGDGQRGLEVQARIRKLCLGMLVDVDEHLHENPNPSAEGQEEQGGYLHQLVLAAIKEEQKSMVLCLYVQQCTGFIFLSDISILI